MSTRDLLTEAAHALDTHFPKSFPNDWPHFKRTLTPTLNEQVLACALSLTIQALVRVDHDLQKLQANPNP